MNKIIRNRAILNCFFDRGNLFIFRGTKREHQTFSVSFLQQRKIEKVPIKKNKLILLGSFIVLCFATGLVQAQKMAVQRCADIDRKVPIINIHIDENSNKWVADEKGLFLAQSPDFASIVEIPDSEWALLSVPDGNEELNLPKEQLERVMGPDFEEITAAHLNKKNQELWIGTEYSGVYQFRLKPSLSLIERHHKGNSKLRDNSIQTIRSTPGGRTLIGTLDGLLAIDGKKSDLIGKFFSIDRIKYYSRKIWILSDGEIYESDDKGDLLPLDIDPAMVDGQIIDIAFDQYGLLWIASDIVVRFDRGEESYELFGPAQDFTSQNVNRIAIDQDDALWVGTSDKGVYYIGESSTLSATVVVDKELGCDVDAKNAALKVRASGGQPPYQYQWTGGATGETAQNLGPGEYIVTVTDEQGNDAQAKATIKDTRFELSLKQEKPASPGGGNDGRAVVEVVDSRASYQYAWDNGEAQRRVANLSPGLHTVTVTDKNGCSAIGEIKITESLAPLAVSIKQVEEIKCKGDALASIEAVVEGGQGPYKYQWQGMVLNQARLTNLAAGTYQVTVTDATNASTNAQIRIAEPQALKATAKVIQSASTNEADGQSEVNVNGGTAPYAYTWTNSEKTAKAVQLPAGEHSVTVTDANNCLVRVNIIVTEDILPLSLELVQTNEIKCVGDKAANLTAQISGGKSPFTYQWSNGGTSETIDQLAAGTYQATITDAANNTVSAEFTVKDPTPLTVSISPKAPASTNNADGKASVKAMGGAGKYTYQWDNGETDKDAKKLNAGQHTVTITDANGCSKTVFVEISEDILPLDVQLNITASIQCNGENTGGLQAEVNGGKPPYEYAWNQNNISGTTAANLTGGDYILTVTDAAGNSKTVEAKILNPRALNVKLSQDTPASTNSSDGQATATVTGGTGNYSYQWDSGESTVTARKLKAGSHAVTVSDANGCQTIQEIMITEDILPLQVVLNQTAPITCKGGKTAVLNVEAKGGKPPYQYQWNKTDLNGQQAQNLDAGVYSVTITDANGTTQTAESKVTEPNQLIVSMDKNRPATYEDSKDGRAILSIRGGTPEYQYQWDNGETGKEAKKLTVGNHSVTITDANACQASITFETKKRINPAITAEALRPGQKLQVSQLYFDADSTEAKPASYPALIEIADFLKENPSIKIEVGGHTNNVPPAEYCDQLSTARAKSVATYIVQQGVTDDRVFYRGYGKREPKYSNRTDDGRRRNQRVEIKVLSVE